MLLEVSVEIHRGCVIAIDVAVLWLEVLFCWKNYVCEMVEKKRFCRRYGGCFIVLFSDGGVASLLLSYSRNGKDPASCWQSWANAGPLIR